MTTTNARPTPPAGPLLSQLGGMADARKWGEKLILSLEDYYAGRIKWSDVDPGCVLHGAPGTGKTTFVKALAATAKLPLILATVGEWQSAGDGHLGNLLQAMHASFAAAKAARPCILFIDELDSIPARGATGNKDGYWNQFTNALLKALDGLATTSGVVVMGACNHPALLDPALIRSGRMDSMIPIPLPNTTELIAILKFHLKVDERREIERGRSSDPYRVIAQLCVGMTGADVAKAVRTARARARQFKRVLTENDLIETLDPASGRLDHDYRRRIALHEAGHAVAAYRLLGVLDLNISLVAAGGRLGTVHFEEAPAALTRKRVEQKLIQMLAGRAAEQVFLGDVSSGAGGTEDSDLGSATKLATRAVTRLGLATTAPLVWLGIDEDRPLSEYPVDVRTEVVGMLSTAFDEAVRLIEREWDFVNLLSEELMRKRALSRKEIIACDRKPKPKPTIFDFPGLFRPAPARRDIFEELLRLDRERKRR